jgi:uncharacterized membrane protein YgcG
MYDITLDDFPPDPLAEIVHWRNDPVVNRYLRQGILTLETVQGWYAKYFSTAEHKLFAVYADKTLIGYPEAQRGDGSSVSSPYLHVGCGGSGMGGKGGSGGSGGSGGGNGGSGGSGGSGSASPQRCSTMTVLLF